MSILGYLIFVLPVLSKCVVLLGKHSKQISQLNTRFSFQHNRWHLCNEEWESNVACCYHLELHYVVLIHMRAGQPHSLLPQLVSVLGWNIIQLHIRFSYCWVLYYICFSGSVNMVPVVFSLSRTWILWILCGTIFILGFCKFISCFAVIWIGFPVVFHKAFLRLFCS